MLISSKNTFTGTFRLVFDQISGHCGLARLTQETNHPVMVTFLLLFFYCQTLHDHLFMGWLLVTLEVTTVAT